ncbi:MAG: adenylate kinase [Deltaproteobacteria bacterium]|nr:adenylate kinase [Deltaproteobacteria bacterium]
MNLVFVGPPGAGKGTQAEAILKAFPIPQISTGDIIRATISGDGALADECRRYTEKGLLVPDDLVNRMVDRRLQADDCRPGFLLDGYPRTVNQAEALEAMLERRGRALDHVLLLDIVDDLLVERITGRRSDPETGKIYHLKFDPPPAEVVNRLVQREDDTEQVLRRRLTEYHEKTAPLLPFYQERGLLRRIDGTQSMAQVRKQILQVLGG